MNDEIIYSKLEDADIEQTKRLIRKYMEWINIDLSFQDIHKEMAYFPKTYQEPEGAFFIAKAGNAVIACIGMKKIGDGICEMKRLFVIDAHQGKGIGKTLINMLLEEAKKKGYKKIRLDTLKKMEDAQRLYRQFGFYEIAQYVENPIEGTIFMEKSL